MLLFQFVNETSLEVCLKDIQRYDATHDPITVNYMAIGCEYAQKITWHSVTKVSMKYASQFLPNCSGHEHYLWNMKHSSCVLKTIQWFESLKKLFYIHNRLTKVKDNIVFTYGLSAPKWGESADSFSSLSGTGGLWPKEEDLYPWHSKYWQVLKMILI